MNSKLKCNFLDDTAFTQLDTVKSEEGVFKISYPHTDARVDGTVLPRFMGLTNQADVKPGV